MTKQEEFLWLVQTKALAYGIQNASDLSFSTRLGMAAYISIKVKDAIPDSISSYVAAGDVLQYLNMTFSSEPDYKSSWLGAAIANNP